LSDGYQDFTRQSAVAAGARAERAAAVALDRLEDVCLWVQQQGLSASPGSQSLADAGRALFRLRRQVSPVPHQLGRLAAGSTYFGLRLGLEAYRVVLTLLDETMEFARAEGPR
jgi:hypothetical protein